MKRPLPLRRAARLLGVACFAGWAMTAAAAPALRSASIRFGMTPAIPQDAFAQFNFTVENPDPEPAEAVVTLQPEGPGPVYSKLVRIGPEALLEDRLLITTSGTENYEAIFTRSRGLPDKEKVVTRLETARRATLFLINDDYDFTGASDLIRASGVLRNVRMTSVRAALAPDHWMGFGDALLVVMVAPNFREMNQWQMQAVRDFVQRGGTLLWIKPEGMLAAADTGLRDLLPVVPLRTRRVEDFSFLRHLLPPAAEPAAPLLEPEGLLFLESLPAGEGVTTQAMGEFPVCRWRRSGLGTVGALAFDPCQKFFQRNGLYVPLWNHALAWATHAPADASRGGDRAFARLLELVSGFRIPGVGPVQAIIFGYLAVLALLLFIGFRFRREAVAWVLMACVGLALTGGIFYAAQRLATRQSRQTITAITLAAWADQHLSGRQDLSLFSRGDTRPTLTAADTHASFYPWASRSYAGMAERESWTTPLRSIRRDGLSAVENISVQALRPRKLTLAFRADAPLLPAGDATLRHGPEGPQLAPFTLPAGTPPPRHAFLVQAGGLTPLALDGLRLDASGSRAGLLTVDQALIAARDYLATVRAPFPCVALISTLDAPRPRLFAVSEGAFSEFEYRCTLLPLTQELLPGPALVPPAAVVYEPADARARLLLNPEGEWVESHLRGEVEWVALHAVLPPLLAGLQPDRVEVDLEISNPGGNVVASVELFDPRRQPAKAPGKIAELPAGRMPAAFAGAAGTQFRFTGFAAAGGSPIDPATGRLGVLLLLSQKKILTNPMDVERANRWKINSLQVTVRGEQTGPDTKRY